MSARFKINIKLNLFWKFSFAIILIVLLFGSINTYLIWRNVETALEHESLKRGTYIAKNIANESIEYFLTDNLISLQKLVYDASMFDSTIYFLMILDHNNKIVVQNMESLIPTNVINANLLPNDSLISIRILRPINRPDITIQDIAVPLLNKDVGTVRLGIIQNKIQTDVRATVNIFLRMVGIFLFLGILGAFLFSYFISHQIQSIIRLANELNLETFKANTLPQITVTKIFSNSIIEIKSPDEIDQLGVKFNEMIRRLKVAYNEIQKVQNNLIQSEKLATVGTIAAGLAHELNNPIAGLQGCLRRLQHGEVDPEKSKSYLNMMSEAAKRIENVVRHLLDFSRKQELNFQLINILDCIESATLLVAYQLENSRVSISKDFSLEIPYIYGSKNHLEQVFVNLLLNSIDAINELVEAEPNSNRVISIGLKQDGQYIIVSFADSGIGIKDEDLPRLFEPLFTTKKIGKGTGLGLAVCFNIVQAHSGSVEGINQTEGGAEFIVKLPINNPENYA
jgi:two-component system, NtrC family, sensor kinase